MNLSSFFRRFVGDHLAESVEVNSASTRDRDEEGRTQKLGLSTPQSVRAKLGSSAIAGQMATVGQKVLHAWLQNQHQTMFPLVANFRNIDVISASAVVHLMAVATLAGGAGANARAREAERWLRHAGADEPTLELYQSGVATPIPLSDAIEAVTKAGAATLAYVAVLVATDRHSRADELFVDYVATRLEISSETTRSADRRYRF